MKITRYIAMSLILLMSFTMAAQKKKLRTAAKLFDNYAYFDAIQQYERVASKEYKSVALFQRLGDAYYFNSELEKAAKWYKKLFQLNEPVAAEYYYRYAQALKAIKNYAKADSVLTQFSAMNTADLRAGIYTRHKDYLKEIEKNSGRFILRTVSINSKLSDYGPSFYGDNIVFATNRDSLGTMRFTDAWTNKSFTTLYSAPVLISGDTGEAKPFKGKVQTRFHESTPVFSKDMKTMYFTRNNFNNGKLQTDDYGRILLKIYKSRFKDGKWEDAAEVSFDSNQYSTAHPALSADGKTLYFASNMPGTRGDSDIYKVEIKENGTFGAPENLGPAINTEGRETFPFVHGDRLYFASDGHQGLGGLDIFAAKMEEDGTYKEVLNIGEPVNSPMDDFGFIINETKKGFFTSNRKGGMGSDDIYGFEEIRELEFECRQLLAGVVTDEKTGAVFVNSKVSLYDSQRNLMAMGTTDSAGLYSFKVDCGKTYFVLAEKEEYQPREVTITIPEESGETHLPIAQARPEPVPQPALPEPESKLKVGDDLAKTFGIQQIYFDLGKYNIRPDAAVQLEKIISFMKEYPTAKIDIRSHTDCRASDKYNDTLSENRAKSIREYLVRKGIDPFRLTGRGYGERQLVNKCADGVKCTEEEHQQNRRSEFIIVEI